ncbi:MAG: hypothetical protein EF811_02720 [Methanonatronarchaeia archaeon]|nr:MAG: hypothetical protein EF811_02720 [Methanonatronarchaeia archaeon]
MENNNLAAIVVLAGVLLSIGIYISYAPAAWVAPYETGGEWQHDRVSQEPLVPGKTYDIGSGRSSVSDVEFEHDYEVEAFLTTGCLTKGSPFAYKFLEDGRKIGSICPDSRTISEDRLGYRIVGQAEHYKIRDDIWASGEFITIEESDDDAYISAGITKQFDLEPEYYDLDRSSSEGGHTLGPAGDFEEGTEVEVQAMPDDGWKFSHWSGDISSDSRTVTVTMDSDKSIKANFVEKEPETYTLNTDTVGSGSIGPSFYPEFEKGEEITLNAYPDDGWEFNYWGGDVSGSLSSSITVTMDSDKEVIAHFSQVEDDGTETTTYYDFMPHSDGEGTIQNLESTKELEEGETITIEANPDTGWEFVRWKGDISGTSKQKTITADEDKTIIAYFKETQDEEEEAEGTISIEEVIYDGENGELYTKIKVSEVKGTPRLRYSIDDNLKDTETIEQDTTMNKSFKVSSNTGEKLVKFTLKDPDTDTSLAYDQEKIHTEYLVCEEEWKTLGEGGKCVPISCDEGEYLNKSIAQCEELEEEETQIEKEESQGIDRDMEGTSPGAPTTATVMGMKPVTLSVIILISSVALGIWIATRKKRLI